MPYLNQMSLAVLSRAACASMSTTSTTTTRDRGDRYGPMEWAQQLVSKKCQHATHRVGLTNVVLYSH